MTTTTKHLLQDVILECVQERVSFPVELFFHEDDRELAVINSDTREVLFSTDSLFGVSFPLAYAWWCDEHGHVPF
jgi:hypothetical protein